MPWPLLAALLTLLLALSGHAQAPVQHAPTAPVGYWLDRSKQAGLDEAMRATYEPGTALIGLGYGREPVWVRLTLPKHEAAPAGQDNPPDIVRVRPAYLDHVTLYDPSAGLRFEAGDAVPPRSDDLISPAFSFVVPARAQTHDVYLRVQTTSTRLIEVTAMTPFEAHRRDLMQTIGMSLIIAASLVLTIGTALVWWHQREKVIGLYAISQAMATLFALLTTGIARVLVGAWLPPGWLDTMHSTIVLLLSAMTMYFVLTLLQEYQPPRALLRAAYLMPLGMATLIPVGLWIDWMWVLRLNAVLVLIAICIPILLLFFARPDAQPPPLFPRRRLLLIYVAYLAMVVGNPLTFLGWVTHNELVFYSSIIHILFNGLVIATVLLLRAKAMKRMRHEMQEQLAHEQNQGQIEKQHRQEQEKLFTMLAHELRTPLATLRMWLDAGYERRDAIERAIADMNQVIERCVQTGQLSDHKLVPLFEATDLKAATQTAIALCRDAARVAPEFPEMSAHVRSDAQILAIVLANLLDNACKYSAAQTPIRVRLCPMNGAGVAGWQWSIANTPGPAGLPAPEQVFEKYYRNPQARRQSGSGLGLFLVKGLVELLQGTVHYAPTQDEAVFELWLPAT